MISLVPGSMMSSRGSCTGLDAAGAWKDDYRTGKNKENLSGWQQRICLNDLCERLQQGMSSYDNTSLSSSTNSNVC